MKRDNSEINIRSSTHLQSLSTNKEFVSLASKRSENVSSSTRPVYKDYLVEMREKK